MSDSSSSSSAYAPGIPDKRVKALNKALSGVDLDGHDFPPSPAPSTPRSGRQYALATDLVFTEGTDQYNASSVPIYQVRRQRREQPNGISSQLVFSHGGGPSQFRHVLTILFFCSLQHSNKPRPLVGFRTTTTTPAPAIQLAPTLRSISPRSCVRGEPWWSALAWAHST